MDFKTWLEAQVLQPHMIDRLTQIALKHFGDAEYNMEHLPDGSVMYDAEYPQYNRVLDATLKVDGMGRHYAIINFDWLEEPEGMTHAHQSSKIAAGSKELMRRLKAFVGDLQQAGIGVTYHALGAGDTEKEAQARERAYSKRLKKAGFERASMPQMQTQRWFPKRT
jgi:hypothetical protein